MITVAREASLDPDAFAALLQASGLAERRPKDPAVLAMMAAQADLVVVAREDGRMVGIARTVTDFAYCAYVSDLAVDRATQGQGVGRSQREAARRNIGPGDKNKMISAPAAEGVYDALGFSRIDRAYAVP